MCFTDTFRIPRKGIISTPGASSKCYIPQSEKARMRVNTYNLNTLEAKARSQKSKACLGSLVRSCLKINGKEKSGIEFGGRQRACLTSKEPRFNL